MCDTEIHLKSVMLQGCPVILVINFNITEPKKAETLLKESEERFRTVMENLPCGVSVHDLGGRHLILNEETCRVRGYSREELPSLTIMEKAGLSLGTNFNAVELLNHIETGASFTFETLTQRKDGSLYDSEVNMTKIMLEGQAVILSLVFDIKERKKSEEALKKSAIYLRTLISTIPDLVWLKDIDGYTMPYEEYLRRFVDPGAVKPIEDSGRMRINPDSMHDRAEHVMLYADGNTGYVMSQMFLLKNSKGVPVKAYGVDQDITEWKLAQKGFRDSEEKLARSKKMESLGLLAGGVAHYLNNVLSGIVSYPELLLLDLPAGSKLRKPIETIQESGYKAVAIVKDLLTIARGTATAKAPLNLNRIINEYLNSPEFHNLKFRHPAV